MRAFAFMIGAVMMIPCGCALMESFDIAVEESQDSGTIACDPLCTGGCEAGWCRIACGSASTCERAALACPIGARCVVECDGPNACRDAVVVCGLAKECLVECQGEAACREMQVRCSDAPCGIECSDDGCDHARLACGAGSCYAVCHDSDKLPILDGCDKAASCETCSD
jgi:hypothetical protein